MRVLIVHDYADGVGGAEVLTWTLRDGLRARGHDARVFASRAGGGIDADYLTAGTVGSLRGLVQIANPVAAADLRRVLRTFRPDVVHVRIFLTQLSPLILPVLRDVPALWHVVWLRAICPKGTKQLPDGRSCVHRPGAVCRQEGCLRRREWLPLMGQLRLLHRWRGCFDAVVANSHAVAARLQAEDIAPVEVVYNGVPERAARPALHGPPTVAFAGRLIPGKGARTLVRAFARVAPSAPDARLVIAGDGPLAGELRQLVTTLGLSQRVELTGRLSRPVVEERFDAAWVQAVPTRFEEPFGLVAAEAMMRGTAVVASSSGGLPEVVDDGVSGLLVPPGDERALADALGALLQDRDRADRLGRNGRIAALERFRADRFVDDLAAVHRRLVEAGA
jgi:glycosyltransferase involved in cell wall biosynthesis